jgi:pimeloyl-ACP methyl ester carboxylesterase
VSDDTQFIHIDWAGRAVTIEHRWIGRERAQAPLVVFLHEGLGSLSAWKDFPQRLCDAAGLRGLVFSRPGYGRSTPRAADELWDVDYLHRQAKEVLPAFFAALGIESEKPWLFAHSDGGSIALIHAAAFPDRLAGAVLVAPHIVVEDVSVQSIAQTRNAYLETDLRQRMAKHHADPDSAFWGWNRIWLHPPFRQFNLEHELPAITCPLLAVQGIDDEYGTLAQVRGIQRALPRTQLLELPDCGHAVHKDQPDALIGATAAFIARHAAPWT